MRIEVHVHVHILDRWSPKMVDKWSFCLCLLIAIFTCARLSPAVTIAPSYPSGSPDSFRMVPFHKFSPCELARSSQAHLCIRRSPFSVILMLLAGDIEMNPGPQRESKWKFPCGVCSRPVMKNQPGVQCDKCDLWVHGSCAGISSSEYLSLQHSADPWFCDDCQRESTAVDLPFGNVSSSDSVFNNSTVSVSKTMNTSSSQLSSPIEVQKKTLLSCATSMLRVYPTRLMKSELHC